MPIKFNSAGFLIQAKFIMREILIEYGDFEGLHCGLEWPLEDNYGKNIELVKYIDDFVDLGWPENRADLCIDYEFAEKYYNTCIEEGLDVSILFCMTSQDEPKMDRSAIKQITQKAQFVGYDYGSPISSHISSVYEDVFIKKIPELLDINLNQYGLFDSEESITDYVKRRWKMIRNGAKNFERGTKKDYCYYKIWIVKSSY